MYTLEQGPTEAKIIEQAARLKMDLPDSIKNAPELRFGLELFYTAFMDLSSCRSIGMGQGAIPYSAVMDYCWYHGIEGEQQDEVVYHVRAMDSEYLKHHAKKNG